jgi:hypothetical protein
VDRLTDERITGDTMVDDVTGSIGNETYDGRLEVVDDFIDSLPLGEGGRVDRRSDDSLEDRKAGKKRDSKSRESHSEDCCIGQSGIEVIEVGSG